MVLESRLLCIRGHWYNASNGRATNETAEDYNAVCGHAVGIMKLYYPSVNHYTFLAGLVLLNMPIIDSVYLDNNLKTIPPILASL